MNAMTPPKVPNSFPIVAAVALNLIPLIGVAFWGWSAFALIFLYWLENVVIGVRTLASLAANAMLGGMMNALGAVVFGVFFTVHYGLFCFVHGTFVVALFGGEARPGENLLDLGGVALSLFAREPNLLIGLFSIVAWQMVQFVLFIARGEAKTTNPMALMGAPYPRIMVLHVAILGGGFLLAMLHEPLAGLIVLALVKMGFDVAEAMGKGPRFDRPPPPEGVITPGDARRSGPSRFRGPSTRR
jgi:hypothetical protein